MILEEEVEKIRAVRHRISEKCGHDPKRLLEYYREVSRELRASGQFRFVDQPTRVAESAPKSD